jgi:phosphohistidine phosphatase
MKLYLMRHGPAEDHAPSGRDFDRALTHAGRERTRLVAVELGKRDEAPKRIVSSPLVRAVETARIVATTLELDVPLEESDDLAPGGDGHGLVRRLLAEGARRVMLVGHEPDISFLASQVLPGWSRPFDKAMVLGVRVRADEETKQRFVLEPKTLTWRDG